MVPNSVTLSCHTPLLVRRSGFSCKPSSHLGNKPKIPINPFQISCFTSNFSSSHLKKSSSPKIVFNALGRFQIGFRQLGMNNLRVSAVTNGGSTSGGDGGFGGSGDGGNSGGRGEDGDGGSGGNGSNWSFLSWYLAILEKFPVATKAATSALLTLIGDLICQIVIDKAPSIDLKRTFVFTLLGLALVGPTLHFWYLYLSKLVTMTGASGAFLRLVLDQFLFSPVFIGVFLSMLVTLEGNPSHVVPKLQQEWFSAVVANWQLWIPFQFLNFRFVPQQFQVLAANVLALVWNVILSYKAHKVIIPK